jgi:bifunctional DNA-binding transcriptional regulator/antitoxin component of YhaV-PrlF toxin-antitoxin module
MERSKMTLLRLRRASQLTLPVEVRDALKVKEGDYLEAHIVSDGLLLKPISVVARKRAWAGVLKAVSSVRNRKAARNEKVRSEEEAIAREVKRVRRRYTKQR